MDRATILDDCLARLKAGASLADCLSLYPGQAAELAPLLAAAVQLQDLSGHALSDAQRLRAKVTLRETLASRPAPRMLATHGWACSGESKAGQPQELWHWCCLQSCRSARWQPANPAI